MIKYVLWDIDGTLLDFLKAERVAIRKCFDLYNLGECNDEMLEDYSKINDKYWIMLESNLKTKPQILVERFEEFFGKYNLNTSIAKDFNDSYQACLGDTAVFNDNGLETVLSLKEKGYVQIAVTNGSKIAQDKKLYNSKLDQLLDYICISEVIGIEKPNIGFFKEVFNIIGSDNTNEMIIIGDSLTGDIKGGNNAGIKTIWYNKFNKENNTDSVTDYIINDLKEVVNILDTL